MDTIIPLTFNLDIYMVTLFLMMSIYCRTLFLFLFNKYEKKVAHKSYTIAGRYRLIKARQSSFFHLSPMISWLTILIKRKDSPPDDEDHHLLLIR